MINSKINKAHGEYLNRTGVNPNALLLSSNMFDRLINDPNRAKIFASNIQDLTLGPIKYQGMRILVIANAVDMVEVTHLETSND
jgi:hypothetical protein